VAFSVLVAFCSLAVDYGRAQLVRTELQACADGAARAAAGGITVSVAEAKRRARDVGGLNKAGDTPITFADADFRFGRWNESTNQFDPAGTPIDAVEITARRDVALVFGAMYGRSSVDVSARATARGGASAGHALIGLDWVDMRGTASLDSYDSTVAAYAPGTRRQNGDIGTNGHINLDGAVRIYGDATYKTTLNTTGNAGVVPPGQASQVTSSMSFTAPTLPSSYSDMGSLNGNGNGSLTLTSGNYRFSSFTVSGNFTLNVVGEVNVYVDGPFNLTGHMSIHGGKPGNFRVNMLGSSDATVGGSSALYADVYAPSSHVSLVGTGDLYGRFVGKTVSATGKGGIHFDESLPMNGAGGVSLVK
jgi:hypothetical protein